MRTEAIEALIARQARAWERGDAAAVVADFAPDGVFAAPPIPNPDHRVSGREAIGRLVREAHEIESDITVTITRIIHDGSGDVAAVEWAWEATNRADGRRSRVEDAIVIELRDGLIASWREYFAHSAPA